MKQIGVGQVASSEDQRIIFVEPNDVYDSDAENSQGGISLTPKYEDFCISFNLIIEAFSRFKSSGSAIDNKNSKDENGNVRTYSIEWGLTREDMIKRRTSVLQGNRGKDTLNNPDGSFAYSESDYNYLTTYFTELDFDSYKEKTQIEGLGVESVQISYESWYTPTVTIKFVDVRGSAIFGREEAIHVDEKLTAENIFGAFFTMPYPLFRLQVKGFLGKPVTYQLTCSNFKGEFNSQTGNFEAVATFIGYSWSLLTDVPFAYIVAAPNATYIGADYWERHKNTPDWGLWDDDNMMLTPPKLIDIFKWIREADQRVTDLISASTAEQNEKLKGIENEKKLLNDIKTHLQEFITCLEAQVNSNYLGTCFDNDTKKEQLLIFSDSQTITLNSETTKKFEDLYECMEQYTHSYSQNSITIDKMPNKWTSAPKQITLLDKFEIKTNNEGVTQEINVKELTTLTTNGLQNIIFNDKNDKLTQKTSELLYNAINSQQKAIQVKKYVYLIDFFDINNLINDRLNNMIQNERSIVKEITEQVNYYIKDILGFKPYIGNIFKIVFCHLETFCHIMFDSADEIYGQIQRNQRTPLYLGVNMENTDLAKNVTQNITPWPAIYDNGVKTSECGYISEIENVYGWVGDFSHNFIEEKVVVALQEGIQNIINEVSSKQNVIKQNNFPLLPYDNIFSPFSTAAQNNISDLSANLSMRAASTIGVLCGNNINTTTASLLGRLDAYNYYISQPRINNIKKIFEDKTLADIKGISYCDNKYDVWALGSVEGTNKKYHLFETSKKINDEYNNNDRQPFFKLINNKNLLVHWYDNKKISYIPSVLKDFISYKNDFAYKADADNVYFIPQMHKLNTDGKIKSYNWLYNTNTTKLSFIDVKDREKYVNDYMFNIISNNNIINNVIEKYDNFKKGGCKVLNYEVKDDLNSYINTFLKVGKDYRTKFFKNVCYMLSGKYEQLNIDEKKLLSTTFNGNSNETFDFTSIDWDLKSNKDLKNEVTFNESGNLLWNGNETNINNLSIQQFKVIHFGNECNIFGCPFYYLQNNKIDNNETEEEYKNRTLKVKALLFLHTFKYNYIATDLNVFSRDKKTGGIEIIPKGYLLFLGSMLWRKRYASKHNGKDPIIYSIKDDTDSYKQPTITKTLFVNENNGLYFKTIRSNNNTTNYNYEVKNLFGGIEEIDYNIENQLISLFESFANTTFSKIMNKYELKNKVDENKIIEFDSVSFKVKINVINEFVKAYKKNRCNSGDFEQWLNSNFANWNGHYVAINVNPNVEIKNQGLKMLFNEKDTESQNLFKSLYEDDYLILDACHKLLNKNDGEVTNTDQIWVNNDLYESYISGFLNAIKDIIENDENNSSQKNNNNKEAKKPSVNNIDNRDLSISIYYYLKNLWDKWLVIAKNDTFDVKTFFLENFIFTDSFYRNTYNKLAINCQILLNLWTRLSDNASVFNFLSSIITEHKCIFLPVPDYIGFNGKTQKHDIEMMENLFRPLPYTEVGIPSNNNKFVVMFTHSPSSVQNEDNGYKTDSYDIWSHTEGFTEVAKKLFEKTTSEDFDRNNDIATREGYNVPSFGIAFARQNNHIFKNLKVSMDNPVMTEQAIKTTWNIAQMGSGGGRKVHFVGQDTFNVFSNYSYSIEVEMLGNAQICPLMYFQLMNIPLWRGTYMIYKVVHNMTPGNMTTTFTGMKMSKYAKPFNSLFFAYNPYEVMKKEKQRLRSSCDEENNTDTNSTNSMEYIDNGVYGKPGIFSGKTRQEKRKLYHIEQNIGPAEAMQQGLIVNVTFNQTGGTKTLPMNKYIAEDFKAICNEILALGWFNLNVGNCYRPKNSLSGGRVSRHCWGIAVDINPGSGGNPWFNTHIPKNQPEPAEGSQAPWSTQKSHYNGTYDRRRCIWHWGHPVVKIFLAHGWGWGGAYGDVMHFSIDDGH